jgi:hypothetical protein
MSVTIIKQYDPPQNISVRAWKCFVLHENGTLGPLVYYYPEETSRIQPGIIAESKYGWCLFLKKKFAEEYRARAREFKVNQVVMRITAIGKMVDGKIGDLPCAIFKQVLVSVPKEKNTKALKAVSMVRQ